MVLDRMLEGNVFHCGSYRFYDYVCWLHTSSELQDVFNASAKNCTPPPPPHRPHQAASYCRALWHFIFWVHNFHKIIIKIGAKWSSHLQKWLRNYRARKWSVPTCWDLNKHFFLIRFDLMVFKPVLNSGAACSRCAVTQLSVQWLCPGLQWTVDTHKHQCPTSYIQKSLSYLHLQMYI